MKKRYHIVKGEPNSDGPEWFVLDRIKVHPDCFECEGIAVHTATTRRAAREECSRLNADEYTTAHVGHRAGECTRCDAADATLAALVPS
jgi:hypothetical protein